MVQEQDSIGMYKIVIRETNEKFLVNCNSRQGVHTFLIKCIHEHYLN